MFRFAAASLAAVIGGSSYVVSKTYKRNDNTITVNNFIVNDNGHIVYALFVPVGFDTFIDCLGRYKVANGKLVKEIYSLGTGLSIAKENADSFLIDGRSFKKQVTINYLYNHETYAEHEGVGCMVSQYNIRYCKCEIYI